MDTGTAARSLTSRLAAVSLTAAENLLFLTLAVDSCVDH
jgi:hypothetical protein